MVWIFKKVAFDKKHEAIKIYHDSRNRSAKKFIIRKMD